MKTTTLRATAGLATALAAGLAGAQTYGSYYPTAGYAASAIVRCESINSDRNFCRADTRGGVQIVRQLSRENCIRGRNWDVRSDGIVVDDGCRAEFALGTSTAYGYGYGSSSPYYGTGYPGTDRYGRPLVVTGQSYVTDRYGNRIYVTSRDMSRGYVVDRYGNQIMLSGHRYTTTRDRYGNVVYANPYGSTSSGGYYSTDRYGNRIWVSTGAGGYYVDQYGRRVYTTQGYGSDDDYDNDGIDDSYEGYGAYGGTYTSPSTYSSGVINCTSAGVGRTYCGDRNQTYILHTDNSSYCLYNRTDGRDENGTWVSGGCNIRMETNY